MKIGSFSSVLSAPAELPEIDWASYKRRAPALTSVIDQFEKQYKTLKLPYPTGDELLAKIDRQEKHDVS